MQTQLTGSSRFRCTCGNRLAFLWARDETHAQIRFVTEFYDLAGVLEPVEVEWVPSF